MSLAPGFRLGAYEIIAAVGAGGMGEVYRARDTRLNRDVAIKVLPEHFAADPERLARFEREAQVLAALNHPHIAQIHGVEESNSVRALVMEYVDGPTLAESIIGAGGASRLGLDEALAIARQLADALEAAHERGIIHRDLKPANIKIRPDGTVKVLDFGLAKALHDPAHQIADIMNSPTMTGGGSTRVGVILGTAAYMAPEQAKGKALDKRVDIWAFGCVLFEMLTGRPVFDGETATEVVAAVITREPNWAALPATVPEHVRHLLHRCLEKEPRRRLRDIGDTLVDLDPSSSRSASTGSTIVAPGGTSPRRASDLWIRAAVVASIAIAGGLVGRFVLQPARETQSPIRFEIGVSGATGTSVAPDGSKIAVSSRGSLHVRDLDGIAMRDLPGTEGAVTPFWSPDSRAIGYGAKGKLWRVPAAGGQPDLIGSLPEGAWDQDAGGAWMPDDTIVFTNGSSPLMRVPAGGGDLETVVRADAASELHFHNATALPDGRGVLFVTHRKVGADSIEAWAGGMRHLLVRMEGQGLSNPSYAPGGYLLFHRQPTNSGLWAVKFSLDRLQTEGQPFLLIAGANEPSISRNSRLVYTPDPGAPPGRLVLVDRQGRIASRIHDDYRLVDPFPALSPDATRLVVTERAENGSDLWVYDIQKRTRTRLTADGSARRPAWGSDGRTVFYTSLKTGQAAVVKQVAADGSGRQEQIAEGRDPAASRDGRLVLYARDGDLYYSPLAGDKTPVAFLKSPANEGLPQLSPDGRYVMFTLVSSAYVYSFIKPFPSGDAQWQISAGNTPLPKWGRDGKHVYYALRDDIMEIDLTTQPEFSVGLPRKLFTRASFGLGGTPGFDVSADGQHFLIVEPDPAFVAERSIAVVVNFKP